MPHKHTRPATAAGRPVFATMRRSRPFVVAAVLWLGAVAAAVAIVVFVAVLGGSPLPMLVPPAPDIAAADEPPSPVGDSRSDAGQDASSGEEQSGGLVAGLNPPPETQVVAAGFGRTTAPPGQIPLPAPGDRPADSLTPGETAPIALTAAPAVPAGDQTAAPAPEPATPPVAPAPPAQIVSESAPSAAPPAARAVSPPSARAAAPSAAPAAAGGGLGAGASRPDAQAEHGPPASLPAAAADPEPRVDDVPSSTPPTANGAVAPPGQAAGGPASRSVESGGP